MAEWDLRKLPVHKEMERWVENKYKTAQVLWENRQIVRGCD